MKIVGYREIIIVAFAFLGEIACKVYVLYILCNIIPPTILASGIILICLAFGISNKCVHELVHLFTYALIYQFGIMSSHSGIGMTKHLRNDFQ
jgi:hypothetical protein